MAGTYNPKKPPSIAGTPNIPDPRFGLSEAEVEDISMREIGVHNNDPDAHPDIREQITSAASGTLDTEARRQAAAAQTAANNAQTTANTAKSTADGAVTDAASAQTAANTAATIAGNAQTAASAAQRAADLARIRDVNLIITVSPGDIDLNNIPSRYGVRLDFRSSLYQNADTLRMIFAGETRTVPVTIGSGTNELTAIFPIDAAAHTNLEGRSIGEQVSFAVALLDTNSGLTLESKDTDLTVVQTQDPVAREQSGEAGAFARGAMDRINTRVQDLNSFMAGPDAEFRVYRKPSYSATIVERDQLDGDYIGALTHIDSFELADLSVDSIRILVVGSDDSKTEVHRQDWSIIQNHRTIEFNVNNTEESGAAGKIQRSLVGFHFYNFILEFYDDTTLVRTTTPAQIILEDEVRTIRELPVYPEDTTNELEPILQNDAITWQTRSTGGTGTSIDKTTNPQVDTVRNQTNQLDLAGINDAARSGLDDDNFMTLSKTARFLQRILKIATNSTAGIVALARNAEYDATSSFNNTRAATVFGIRRILASLNFISESDIDGKITTEREARESAVGGVDTKAQNALDRTAYFRPLTVWDRTEAARTIRFEYKPLQAVHTSVNATVVVGGSTINNVNPSEGLAALDNVGVVLEVPIDATQAANITNSTNARNGFVRCQIRAGSAGPIISRMRTRPAPITSDDLAPLEARSATITTPLTIAASIEIDMSQSAIHGAVLNRNVTFTLSDITPGIVVVLILSQDTTGSRTVTFPASVVVPGGKATGLVLSTTASTTDEITLLAVSRGIVHASLRKDVKA